MILTDDEIRKAAEFAAAQMWPESGYVGWTEDDAVFHRKFIEACFDKLLKGVEVPEPFAHAAYEEHPSYEGVGDIVYYHPNAKPANCIDLFTRDQVNTLLAARALAGQQWLPIESAPKDGTYVLLGSSDGAWVAKYRDQYQSGFSPDNKWQSMMLNHDHMGRYPRLKPTHWQPLPHPPAPPQEQQP